MELPLAISWDAALFLGFVIVFVLVVAYTIIHRRGSGISRTPTKKASGPGDSAGDVADSEETGVEMPADEATPGEGDPQHGAQ